MGEQAVSAVGLSIAAAAELVAEQEDGEDGDQCS